MEYYTDDDYNPPSSPPLVAIRPRLELGVAEEPNYGRQREEDIDISGSWDGVMKEQLDYLSPDEPSDDWDERKVDVAPRSAPETTTRSTTRRLSNLRRKQRQRFVLPIMIVSGANSVIVTTCPDSGSDDNIISRDFAMSAGFKIQVPDSEPRRFSVASGKIVEAVGQVQAHCAFVAEHKRIPDCIFHVFNTLAVPVIMGMDFLRQTETLTKHTYRLVKELAPAMQSLRVNSVGKPKQSLLCRLNNYVGCARPDTGSDLDLVSRKFAKSRGFAIEPAFEQLEFADCSIGYTSGLVRGAFSIGDFSDVRGFLPRGGAIDLEFYVLEGLNSDILLGQDTIDELGIFRSHLQSFIPSIPCLGESDVNIIRHIGRLERSVSEKLKELKHTILGGTPRRDDDHSQNFETQTKLHEQRENARLEALRPPPVPVVDAVDDSRAHERRASQTADLDGLRANYSSHLHSTTSLTTGSALVSDTTQAATDRAPPESPYRSGLDTSTFVVQSPIDSHIPADAPARPHFCPIAGCPRSEGGRGFERKTEMIRHGLVHDSPGYVCPFCTDREHKYPRPDNLKRHVRVHHVDKDREDPVLRAVLSQLPDGPSRGRRRTGWAG